MSTLDNNDDDFFNDDRPLMDIKRDNIKGVTRTVTNDDGFFSDDRSLTDILKEKRMKKQPEKPILGSSKYDEDEEGIELLSALSQVYELEEMERKEDTRRKKREQSYRDLQESVSTYDSYFDELEKEIANSYTKQEVDIDFNYIYRPHYNKEGKLSIRLRYDEDTDGKDKIVYREIPDYIKFRKDGVYYSSGYKRSLRIANLSTYGLYTIEKDGSKTPRNPNDSQDARLIREFLITFKYLNNKVVNYKWYMVYLSMFFDGFDNLESFAKWYSTIKVEPKRVRTVKRNILVSKEYCDAHQLDYNEYQKQKNMEYFKKVNNDINKYFVLNKYKELSRRLTKTIYYETIQAFLEDRSISLPMIKKYLNDNGIFLKSHLDDQIGQEIVYLFKIFEQGILDGKSYKNITLERIQDYLKVHKRLEVSLPTISKLIKENGLDIKRLQQLTKKIII